MTGLVGLLIHHSNSYPSILYPYYLLYSGDKRYFGVSSRLGAPSSPTREGLANVGSQPRTEQRGRRAEC